MNIQIHIPIKKSRYILKTYPFLSVRKVVKAEENFRFTSQACLSARRKAASGASARVSSWRRTVPAGGHSAARVLRAVSGAALWYHEEIRKYVCVCVWR